MYNKCIYCSSEKQLTKDHIPPKNLFPSPRPSNLITVPCCEKCNKEFGKVDERARNLLTSLNITEFHSAIKSEIESKRNRSFLRKKGYTNLKHMLNSMTNVDTYTKGGIYLGKLPAFNLNQDVMDKYLERITRALLFHENQVTIFNFNFRWKLSPKVEDFEKMRQEMKNIIGSAKVNKIGDDIFQYVGIFYPGKSSSIWFLRFYDGIEFITFLKERNFY